MRPLRRFTRAVSLTALGLAIVATAPTIVAANDDEADETRRDADADAKELFAKAAYEEAALRHEKAIELYEELLGRFDAAPEHATLAGIRLSALFRHHGQPERAARVLHRVRSNLEKARVRPPRRVVEALERELEALERDESGRRRDEDRGRRDDDRRRDGDRRRGPDRERADGPPPGHPFGPGGRQGDRPPRPDSPPMPPRTGSGRAFAPRSAARPARPGDPKLERVIAEATQLRTKAEALVAEAANREVDGDVEGAKKLAATAKDLVATAGAMERDALAHAIEREEREVDEARAELDRTLDGVVKHLLTQRGIDPDEIEEHIADARARALREIDRHAEPLAHARELLEGNAPAKEILGVLGRILARPNRPRVAIGVPGGREHGERDGPHEHGDGPGEHDRRRDHDDREHGDRRDHDDGDEEHARRFDELAKAEIAELEAELEHRMQVVETMVAEMNALEREPESEDVLRRRRELRDHAAGQKKAVERIAARIAGLRARIDAENQARTDRVRERAARRERADRARPDEGGPRRVIVSPGTRRTAKVLVERRDANRAKKIDAWRAKNEAELEHYRVRLEKEQLPPEEIERRLHEARGKMDREMKRQLARDVEVEVEGHHAQDELARHVDERVAHLERELHHALEELHGRAESQDGRMRDVVAEIEQRTARLVEAFEERQARLEAHIAELTAESNARMAEMAERLAVLEKKTGGR